MPPLSRSSVEASSLRDQVATIRRALVGSPVRKWLLWTSVGIMAVIVATSIGQVLLNRWNQPFYDALARRDMAAFLHQLLVFADDRRRRCWCSISARPGSTR